jgi:hypothetical protein
MEQPHDPDILLADGFEEALIGYGTRFSYGVAVYSTSKCLDILMKRDGMTHEEAMEFFTFNVTGAYVGENTPVFLEDLEENYECEVWCDGNHEERS